VTGHESLLFQWIQDIGFDLCLRLLVTGRGNTRANLARLVRIFDQFSAGNKLAVWHTGDENERYRVNGRFFPAGRRTSLVTPPELAALVHLPNAYIVKYITARFPSGYPTFTSIAFGLAFSVLAR